MMNGYNTDKPEIIKKIEKDSEVLSFMTYRVLSKNEFELIDNKLETIWSNSHYNYDGEIFWHEKIYKTKQSFYIRVLNNREKEIGNIWFSSIYYKQEQFNELILFIKSLTKELENARINNTRIETKN